MDYNPRWVHIVEHAIGPMLGPNESHMVARLVIVLGVRNVKG